MTSAFGGNSRTHRYGYHRYATVEGRGRRVRGAGFGKRFRACKTHTNSHPQTAPLLSRKVSCDTHILRAHTQNCQLPGTATAWKKRRLSAPVASRASQHLPQKVYPAVATVSLRNFVRALVASRAEPEPEKARLDISQKTGGQQYTKWLPREVMRLQGGMGSLGSFIGTDDFVRSSVAAAVADETVDGIANGKGLARGCALLRALANGNAKHGRDGAGYLLMVCVIPKLTYLCRTIPPDLMVDAARDADARVRAAFAAIWGLK